MGRVNFGYFVDKDKYYCWFCNEVKLIDEFVKDITKTLGFKTKCKKCNNEYHRKWRGNNENYNEYIKNRYDRSYSKEYYEKNREKLLGLQKIWRDKNREKIKENNKKNYEKNREDIIKQNKEYYQLNKNKKNND